MPRHVFTSTKYVQKVQMFRGMIAISFELLASSYDDGIKRDNNEDECLCVSARKLYGPHICGDALDIDPTHNHILTGSWRTETPLQVGIQSLTDLTYYTL